MAYKEAMQLFVNIGLLDVILPFILVFTLMYAILQKVKLFKEKKFNLMIAFTTGFLIVLATNVLNILNTAIQYMAIVLFLLIIFAMIIGLTGADHKSKFMRITMTTLFIIIMIFVLIKTKVIPEKFVPHFIIAIIILATIMYFLKEKKEPDKKNSEKKEEKPSQGQQPTPAKEQKAPENKEDKNKPLEFGPEQLKKEGTIWKES